MAEFTAHRPDDKVLGAVIIATSNIMGAKVRPILEANGLGEIIPEQWYPIQQFLNVFRDISNQKYGVMFNLISIGMDIAQQSLFPPHLKTLPEILMSMDAAYHMNNVDPDGGWEVHQEGEKRFVCRATTPYPSDMEYGVLHGICRRFLTTGTNYRVSYASSVPTRKEGAESCTFVVEWG